MSCCLQSQSLADNQTLTTLLPGQTLTVYLKGPGRVVISGVQTAANVTQADIMADKVPAVARMPLPSCVLLSTLTASYTEGWKLQGTIMQSKIST